MIENSALGKMQVIADMLDLSQRSPDRVYCVAAVRGGNTNAEVELTFSDLDAIIRGLKMQAV